MPPKKTSKVTEIQKPSRSTRVLAISNNKGGVGKTTTAMNLAGAFVLQERKVLVIDMDPQTNASIAFNVEVSKDNPGIRHVLMNEKMPLKDCVYERGPFCDFIPSDLQLEDIQRDLYVDPQGRLRLREKLHNWLRVLDTTERPQIDQGICHQLHPIVSLLDAFKSKQQSLELVFPRKGPLDMHA